MQLSSNHTDYLAPQSEVIVVRVESNFMTGTTTYSGTYRLGDSQVLDGGELD